MVHFKGESVCCKCTLKAYYEYHGNPYCGRHSTSLTDRATLKPNPNSTVLRDHEDEVMYQASINRSQGRPGRVIVRKMYPRKTPPLIPGCRSVFPNHWHGGRKDGYGCPSLSPMSMGEIEHGIPGLPPASCLENLYQGNKVFREEVDTLGNPTELYYANRLSMYADPTPHRHKYQGTGANKNIPLYAIYTDIHGVDHRYDYITTRKWYCDYYTWFALSEPEFNTLQEWLNDGVNLVIYGYDGFDVTQPLDVHYNDASHPFGHEAVLYTLLTTPPRGYPWIKFNA